MRIFNLKLFILSLIATLALGARATVWDFSSFSDTDVANLTADAANWTHETGSNNRFKNKNNYSNSPLMANGAELECTKGLLFTINAADAVRVDIKSSRVAFNKVLTVTIPGLKAGQTVTVNCKSSSKDIARGINVGNLTPVSGFFNQTTLDSQTNVATVTADGDVTLTNTGGLYVYNISVNDGGTTPVNPGNDDHSAAMNTGVNQLRLTLADNSVKYYNTDDIRSIDFNEETETVSIVHNDWTDDFVSNVTAIDFAKASGNGGSGEIVNKGVEIFEASGWFETAYAKWRPFAGAESYNVYVKGGAYKDYTRIDNQLVRKYADYGRADMPGLPAGTYSLKVVPVSGGKELAESASEALDMDVKPYNRGGFAFKDVDGLGAYRKDGSLKPNARVIYVTSETAKTVKVPVLTGKTDTECTGLQTIIDAYQKGLETRPLCVRFVGCVKASDLDKMSSDAEGLQVKGKGAYSMMNITLEGIGDDATVSGFGFLVRNAQGVEFRNFAIMNFMDDGISLDTKNSHVWIHNMDFFYGSAGGDSDQAKGDGTVDLKDDTQFVTIAYNRFWDSGKASLCGMKSESGPNYIDYHHNWFDHSDSRMPRVRTMTVHVWNNYYDGVAKYGVGATMGSSVFVENNFYRHTNDPMMISKQGTDAKGSGTFSGENGGMIKSFGNVYAEKGSKANYTVITHKDSSTDFDCYEAATREEKVPSTYKAKVGSTTYDNFDTDASKMHEYTVDATMSVPSIVTGFYGAGRINHGDFKWTFNNAKDDTDYNVNSALKSAVTGYKSSFLGFYTDDTTVNPGPDNPDPVDPDDPDPVDPTPGDKIICDFMNNAPSNPMFTVNGNYAKNKGTVTYDGKPYSICLKMESSTSISFTLKEAKKITLVFGNNDTASAKINGTKINGSGSIYSQGLAAGSYTITKDKSVNLFLIVLE